MSAAPKVWLVIPTYNERLNLEALVRRITTAGPWNILIVDDASPDGTGELADELHQRWPQLTVLHRRKKEGLGPAYRHGLREVLDRGADLVIQSDADLSHPPELIPTMIERLQTADLVIASRYVAGGRMNIGWQRRWISLIGNVYIRSMLGWSVRDWSTGFKGWQSGMLDQVLKAPLRTTGYACLMETTWWASKLGGRIAEVPLDFVDRSAGDSKFSIRIILEDIRMAWELRWRR